MRLGLAIAAFIYGCTGLTFGLLMINYIMIVDWPQNIVGKPSFSIIENLDFHSYVAKQIFNYRTYIFDYV